MTPPTPCTCHAAGRGRAGVTAEQTQRVCMCQGQGSEAGCVALGPALCLSELLFSAPSVKGEKALCFAMGLGRYLSPWPHTWETQPHFLPSCPQAFTRGRPWGQLLPFPSAMPPYMPSASGREPHNLIPMFARCLFVPFSPFIFSLPHLMFPSLVGSQGIPISRTDRKRATFQAVA